jgi:hypothetical protein
VKDHALLLVGAETRTILHPENKKKQRKRGTEITLPASGIGEVNRFDEGGNKLYSPNWGQTDTHPDNRDFMEALISAVCVVPVSISPISVEQW